MTRVRYEDKAQNAIKTQFRANYKNEKCSTELSLSINYVKKQNKNEKKKEKRSRTYLLNCYVGALSKARHTKKGDE